MLLDKLFANLNLTVDTFATCGISPGWRLTVPGLDWVVLHFVMEGNGALRDPRGTGVTLSLPCYSLAVVPTHLQHDLECGPEVSHSAQIAGGTPTKTPVPHYSAGSSGDGEFMVACGRFKAVYGEGLDLFGQLHDVLVMDFSDSPTMRSTFAAVLEEQRTAGPASAAMMSALLSQCLVLMFRRLAEQENHTLPWLAALEDSRLAKVVTKVLDDSGQPLSLEGLADVAGMSRSAFAKHFQEGFGRTPMDYVREVRLRSGAQLLGQPDLSIDAIATRVGFASRSHFSKAFSEQFGCSPTAFRTQPTA
jgi:AraC family transcriptional activator of mtrCDE